MSSGNLIIKNSTIYTPFQKYEEGVLSIRDGIIQWVGQRGNGLKGSSDGAQVIDGQGLMAVPGFIDIHVHGGGGHEAMDATDAAINTICATHARGGTTCLLPTTWAAPIEGLLKTAEAVYRGSLRNTGGAKVLGLNVESPYISLEKKGAQDRAFIRKPSIKEFDEIFHASGEMLKVITIAPECVGALDFIKHAKSWGVNLFMGHSSSTYDQAMLGIKEGITGATHLFNGMPPLHHREPGVVGAALDSEAFVEVIADCIHLHKTVLRIVAQVKGDSKVLLITDAMTATGMSDGSYIISGRKINVKNGVVRLASGELAGSTLTMNKAVKNMVMEAGVNIASAIKMATYNPACALGMDGKVGVLEPGKEAHVVLLDEKFNVKMTIVDGEIVYNSL